MMIRPMHPRDIAAGMRLNSLAGWNQVAEDWRLFLDSRPEGCFVAVHEDTVIGTVTTAGYGSNLAWISMLLVDPAYRRQGTGTRLMETAVTSLSSYATIMLDATPAGQALYERLGFREQSRLLRLATDGLPSLGALSPEEWALRHFWPDETLDQVAKLDRAVFGADRTPLLKALASRASEAAWVAWGDGRIAGFCLGRNGARFQHLGPVVAQTSEEAMVLCRAGLAAWSGQAAIIDVPAGQERFIGWLCKVGFTVQRPFTRMVLGKLLTPSQAPARSFAICGPEFG